jgi:hypothetical protein
MLAGLSKRPQAFLSFPPVRYEFICDLLTPFQIIDDLTFLTSSSTAYFIQKIFANTPKVKSIMKFLIDKARHIKNYDILHIFFE